MHAQLCHERYSSGGSGPFANCLAAVLHLAPTTSLTGFVEFLGASVVNLAPIILQPEVGRWTRLEGEGDARVLGYKKSAWESSVD